MSKNLFVAPQKTKRGKPNFLYAITSITLVLFLMGIFGLIVLHMQSIIDRAKENIPFSIELYDEATMPEIKALEVEISGSEYAKKSSVRYISKEEAAEILSKEFGEDINSSFGNPMYNSIEFNLRGKFLQKDTLQNIIETIKEQKIVRDVFYQQIEVTGVASNLKRLSIFALVLSVFFIIIAITLINNTIRLAIYSNRFIIKNMQLVGASWDFISRPFVQRGIVNGFISGLIAVTGLMILLSYARKNIDGLSDLGSTGSFTILFLILIALGILISGLSTYLTVNKYLKMKIDELY